MCICMCIFFYVLAFLDIKILAINMYTNEVPVKQLQKIKFAYIDNEEWVLIKHTRLVWVHMSHSF